MGDDMKESLDLNRIIYDIKQEYRKLHMYMESRDISTYDLSALRKAITSLPKSSQSKIIIDANSTQTLTDSEFYKTMTYLGLPEVLIFGKEYMYNRDSDIKTHDGLRIMTRTALEREDLYLIAQIHLRLYSSYQYEKLDIQYLEFVLNELPDATLDKLYLKPNLSTYDLGKKNSYPIFHFQYSVQDACKDTLVSSFLLTKCFKLKDVLLAHNEVASLSCCFVHDKPYSPPQKLSPMQLSPTRASESDLRSV